MYMVRGPSPTDTAARLQMFSPLMQGSIIHPTTKWMAATDSYKKPLTVMMKRIIPLAVTGFLMVSPSSGQQTRH